MLKSINARDQKILSRLDSLGLLEHIRLVSDNVKRNHIKATFEHFIVPGKELEVHMDWNMWRCEETWVRTIDCKITIMRQCPPISIKNTLYGFQTLNGDILTMIFGYLETVDLVCIKKTCKLFSVVDASKRELIPLRDDLYYRCSFKVIPYKEPVSMDVVKSIFSYQ